MKPLRSKVKWTHGEAVSQEKFYHKKLGWLSIQVFKDGWIRIFHKSGKLLNEHYSTEVNNASRFQK